MRAEDAERIVIARGEERVNAPVEVVANHALRSRRGQFRHASILADVSHTSNRCRRTMAVRRCSRSRSEGRGTQLAPKSW